MKNLNSIKNISKKIHGDSPTKNTEESYTNFLVTTPLQYIEPNETSECGYGTFHQLYRIDGKLVAVGVVDVLPLCLSSVYFFYDPDFSFLSIGVYSALSEIEWVKNAMKNNPQLKYYYMGFYIHSCKKMRYKGQYKPSDLLCPESYNWIPLSECVPKLEKVKYTRLMEGIPEILNQQDQLKVINQIPLFYRGSIIHFQNLNQKGKEIMLPKLTDYLNAVGPSLAMKILYYFK